jgi:hypothetical protein
VTLSSLLAWLERDAIEQVRSEISRPLQAFRRGLAERGRSAPVELDREEESPVIGRAHVRALLEGYVAGKLERVELYYIGNVLVLSDAAFADDSTREISFLLAEGEVSGEHASQLLVSALRGVRCLNQHGCKSKTSQTN